MSKRPETETIGLDGFLDIAIDRDAEVPIGVQLAWALRTRIHDGRFKPSQRLPGLRDLAETIGVNVNTVRAVYQRLEHEGLIDSQQGSGTFVASVQRRPSAVGTIAADAAREAHATGVDPREVAAALYVTSESTDRPVDEAAEQRRLLRSQIAGLERTLGELESEHPGLISAPATRSRGPGPTLPNVAELERIRTQMVRRLVTLQAAIDAQAPSTGFTSLIDQRASERERKRANLAKRTASGKRAAADKRAADGARATADKRTTAGNKSKTPARTTPTGDEKAASAAKPKRAPRPRAGTRPAPAGT